MLPSSVPMKTHSRWTGWTPARPNSATNHYCSLLKVECETMSNNDKTTKSNAGGAKDLESSAAQANSVDAAKTHTTLRLLRHFNRLPAHQPRNYKILQDQTQNAHPANIFIISQNVTFAIRNLIQHEWSFQPSQLLLRPKDWHIWVRRR